ncbi:MAG: hypothetical protein CL878_15405 [Dehalococcoidia bacterium]|nr:hypothetical protein [Dehalococcoidia bacterium]
MASRCGECLWVTQHDTLPPPGNGTGPRKLSASLRIAVWGGDCASRQAGDFGRRMLAILDKWLDIDSHP